MSDKFSSAFSTSKYGSGRPGAPSSSSSSSAAGPSSGPSRGYSNSSYHSAPPAESEVSIADKLAGFGIHDTENGGGSVFMIKKSAKKGNTGNAGGSKPISAQKAAQKERAAAAAAATATKPADAPAVEEADETSVCKPYIEGTERGKDLVEKLKTATGPKPQGSQFVKAVLASLSDANSLKWCVLAEFGSAIKYLLDNNKKDQVRALYMIQKHCNAHDYPKITVKEVPRYWIEVVFQLLYSQDVILANAFESWADEVSEEDRKEIAVRQTAEFFQVLRTPEEEEEEEDD